MTEATGLRSKRVSAFRHVRFHAIAAASLVALLGGSTVASAQAIIDNGTIGLGINEFGNLIREGVGITFIPSGGEALAPGCACEGWGISDFGVADTGFGRSVANGNTGDGTATFTTSGTGGGLVGSIAESAKSDVAVLVGGNPYANVTHDFAPSSTANLYKVEVTIRNTGTGPIADLRYRRVMDWDVPPTTFREIVTIQGHPATRLVFTSNDGFNNPNPNTDGAGLGRADAPDNANFENAGPSDHGALFDFSFGNVAVGEEVKFIIYYGAAANEEEALAALRAVGAEVYSLGKPSTNTGTEEAPIYDGAPNTFIFAFSGVGGTPIGGATGPDFLNAMRDFAFLIARKQLSSLSMRMDGTVGGADRLPQTGMPAEMADNLALPGLSVIPTADLNYENAYGVDGLRLFANGGYAFGEFKSFNGNAETDYDMPYFNVGLDYGGQFHNGGPITAGLIGLSVGYSAVNGDISGGNGLDSNGITLSAFGGINFLKGGYADVTGSYTWLNYDYKRTGVAGTFDGDPDGDAISVLGRAGYDFILSATEEQTYSSYFSVGPYGQVEYVKADIDGFTETLVAGAGVPLVIPSQDADSFTTQLGARAQFVFKTEFGAASLLGWAAWEHQFENDAETLVLAGGGNALIGAPDRDYGRVGVRGAVHFAPHITAAAEFQSTVASEEFNDYSVLGRIRFDF